MSILLNKVRGTQIRNVVKAKNTEANKMKVVLFIEMNIFEYK